ncbi:TetR family transcriptional regulator (plasmid) [Alloyangia pacifica]|uniref:TetR family transcriptional regulator n=1 Tax=Alloyangia pacifica TaxID=311180 RepID=A0A2U8HK10_9RHOB|nr:MULTISPECIES: TetR family transcriptional regulator C-terminal domain-containing protein [Roseobacteraceae]AWI86108.1 TetR family transcriptional regulator [Alloyangia pacifica]NDV53562.1 TetR family transcriptional regulator [Salipiger sp. PrR003]NDW35037.1 TetR family transcriptional regulator [Salipiger sp. PrR007]
MSAARLKRKEIHDAIREAALREFASTGLSGTSTQQLAKAAGITKAQLHYYITSKEDLYREVLDGIIGQWRDIFFVGESDDPAEVITGYVRLKLRLALDCPEASRLFLQELGRGAPEMGGKWEGLHASVREATAVIQRWVDEGRMTPVDPLLFMMNIWAVTQHYADYELQSRRVLGVDPGAEMDFERIAAEAVQLFLARAGLKDEGRTR